MNETDSPMAAETSDAQPPRAVAPTSVMEALAHSLGAKTQLEEAIGHYHAALLEITRDRAPLEWAKAHMRLGAAHQSLAEWERGTTVTLAAEASAQSDSEEQAASKILERISQELAPLEDRVQRLMRQYGL